MYGKGTIKMKKKVGYLLYSIWGFLLVFFCYAEYVLAKAGNIVWNISWMAKLLITSILGGAVLGSIVCYVLYKAEEKLCVSPAQGDNKWPKGKKLFVISWACNMICWLPGFFAYYPGIIAYDFPIQLDQITSGYYITHHPLAHTLLMEGFIRLGNQLGSGTFGVALYVLLQMSILAMAMAAMVTFMRRQNIKPVWILGVQILCCLMPSNLYMSISATKDVLFTAFVTLFLLMMCTLLEKQEKKYKLSWIDAGYIVFGTLLIIFRNNGLYALLITVMFLAAAVIFGKKARLFWTKLLSETVIILAVGSLVLSFLGNVTSAVQGDKREMLSVPIQQLARTMVYHGGVGVNIEDDNTMNDVDKALINDFILYEGYKNYKPGISDPVKGNTNTYVFVYRMKDFFKTYINLLTEYPSDYINAFLALTAGYVSPFDQTHANIYVTEGITGLGYIQTRRDNAAEVDVFIDSQLPGLLEKMESFADKNQYLRVPVLNVLMAPGTYLWVFLAAAIWIILHKKYELLMPFSLLLGYYATLFLGPTVQMRYVYPIMTVLPCLIIWAGVKMRKEKEEA